MNHSAPEDSSKLTYPRGYRARRGLNWGFLGLLYTSFYMCRYNLSIANGAISKEFGFSRADIGTIITCWSIAYGFGQILNGMICDKIGGKKSMLIGAVGTILMNILFGAASFWGMLWLFITIRTIDGYLQAYGSPGMIKINAAWFAQRERGRFAGIYGFMINLGRFGIFNFGPALLAGGVFLGMVTVPPLHWRWLFWAPSIICAIVAVGMAIFVKQTPEEAGFHDTAAAEKVSATDEAAPSVIGLVMKMVSHPTIWIVALAYACTGAVRQSIDNWFPRYMEDMFNTDLKSAQFKWLGFLIPFVASAGSLVSGYASDIWFKGRRAPVAAGLYFVETAIILLAAQFHTANTAVFFLVMISLTANSTHSILGTAAAMDIGGRKQSGLASGIIDSFQYFGGSLAGFVLGWFLDKSLNNYFYFMAPFGFIGGLLMLFIMGKVKPKVQTSPEPVPVVPIPDCIIASGHSMSHQEPDAFQLRIKKACVWAEEHQPTLFYSLLILLGGIFMAYVYLTDMKSLMAVFIFAYLVSALLCGGLAQFKRRDFWSWGMFGGLFGITFFVILFLPKLEPAEKR